MNLVCQYRKTLFSQPPRAWVWSLAVALLFACQTGCVRRRLTVRSDPPGARVYIDNYDVGVTPVSTSLTYYGTRSVRLVKDGYETVNVMRRMDPPWYEYPPLDFVSENLYPGELRDQRVLDFKLEPQRIVPTEEVLERAEGLRAGVGRDVVVAAPQRQLPSGTGSAPSAVESFGPGLPPASIPPTLGPTPPAANAAPMFSPGGGLFPPPTNP